MKTKVFVMPDFKWRNELVLNVRYAVAGVFNTFVGLGVIWGVTMIGVTPIIANLIGYAVGLAFGFLNSRRFVFRSEGHFGSEAIRYITAFVTCYLINIVTLQLSMRLFALDVFISQGLAVFSYIVSMYLASRLYIFR